MAKAKAKAKATTAAAPKWLTIECGIDQVFLFAPAEIAVRWTGRAGGSKFRITFQYWQPIVAELPDALRPKHGHRDTPHITVGSQAEATALVEQLRKFILARHPSMKVKKQKELLRFVVSEDVAYWLIVSPESAAEQAVEVGGDDGDAWTWPIGNDRGLLWRVKNHWEGLRVRVTDDEILVVDATARDDELLALVSGDATAHGVWSFKSLLVGSWLWLAVTDFKGIESAKVSALTPFVGKALKPKQPSQAVGGGVVVPAHGDYRAETGGSPKLRWCRFLRV